MSSGLELDITGNSSWSLSLGGSGIEIFVEHPDLQSSV